ncbi:hypothetical protein E3N88_35676 [Mikania micrantha]|uniref:Uncharacterized protein n=1 Tax=Mikania micrantha TaxID=192012 RepID=A0A5N6M2I1_9ASTR|nr:hypothetical protein E3N88_35676 [Mikania micrantha]
MCTLLHHDLKIEKSPPSSNPSQAISRHEISLSNQSLNRRHLSFFDVIAIIDQSIIDAISFLGESPPKERRKRKVRSKRKKFDVDDVNAFKNLENVGGKQAVSMYF